MFEQIIGHKKQIELLSKAFERGKLAHAYVFAGPSGIGKKTLAKNLAQALLCDQSQACGICPQCKTFIAAANADFLDVSGDGGVKIEQIRELSYKLSLKPYLAKNKVALIDEADHMTVEAANALLKVLEEPKAFTYLFLISSNPSRLPKTISSRCQKISFGPLRPEDKSRVPSVLDEETSELLKTADEQFQIFMNERLAPRLIAAYEIADLETFEIKKVLENWIIRLEAMLIANPSKTLAKKITQLTNSRRFLDQNVNSKLLLTNLMINV